MTSGRFHINGESATGSSSNDHTSSSTTASTATSLQQQTNSATTIDIRENEKIRTFHFTSRGDSTSTLALQGERPTGSLLEEVEIKIPELLQSGYSFYTWPCSPILAWFLWERRNSLVGKRILELGAGTALPGILAAKCGAQVLLSDRSISEKSLQHIKRSCTVNNLRPGQDIEVIGLSWGLLLNSLWSLGHLDLIIAADCFYDPCVFEDILVTVSFLLERNPTAKFIFTYQERSADWSIEALLKKWKLCALQINSDDIGKASGVDLLEILGGHTIHLIEITREL
ncbi:histone-arginine methyltransferase METTL23 [Stomoxys calcitrans]|uniref:Methyltransferase-like protein 23 n=1 Tax=Stomoxys calcitrans TaxID=35570 RepID=A0A1I8NM63_STOCA|nr:histone-arginine methyltransferase METTL23 [Stomoxys calcitrans]